MKNFMQFSILAAMLIPAFASAAVINGIDVGAFSGATVEKFNHGNYVKTGSHDFGNGLQYANTAGKKDLISYTGDYGMGDKAEDVDLGKDGDGYFGTISKTTSFAFSFDEGVYQFGFFGAESNVTGGKGNSNGSITLKFYDTDGNWLSTLEESTPGDAYAWGQFHGFASDVAIGRVEFVNVGHMVLDDLHFQTQPIPEPETYALLGIGLAGVAAQARRKRKK